MRIRARQLAATGAFLLAAALVSAAPVHAAPPPAISSPMDCLDQFDDNPDYVGEGWVDALVSATNGISLRCGDERSGVVHIAHPESTGNGHPVSVESQGYFVRCFRAIASRGKPQPDTDYPDSRTRYVHFYGTATFQGAPLPKVATLIIDNERGFVWTMFTAGSTASPRGNDWHGCAEGNIA